MLYKTFLKIGILLLSLFSYFVIKAQNVGEIESIKSLNHCLALPEDSLSITTFENISAVEVCIFSTGKPLFNLVMHITQQKVQIFTYDRANQITITPQEFLLLTPKEFLLKSHGPYVSLNDAGGLVIYVKLNNGVVNKWGIFSGDYSDEVNRYIEYISSLLHT